MRSKKGITPIIAIILLLMMTVAAAGAAFFWLTRIQGQLQGGAETYQARVFETMASQVNIDDVTYYSMDDDGYENITIILRNSGGTDIPISTTSSPPTTSWIFKDSNDNLICSGDWSGSTTSCGSGCDSGLDVGEMQLLILNINSSDCSILSYSNETLFSFTIDFSGKTTASGAFEKK